MTAFFPTKSFPEEVNWDEWRACPLKMSYATVVVNLHLKRVDASTIHLLGNFGDMRNTPRKSGREHNMFHVEETGTILITCRDNFNSPGLCVVVPGGTLNFGRSPNVKLQGVCIRFKPISDLCMIRKSGSVRPCDVYTTRTLGAGA
jgi:hypothetical protein